MDTATVLALDKSRSGVVLSAGSTAGKALWLLRWLG